MAGEGWSLKKQASRAEKKAREALGKNIVARGNDLAELVLEGARKVAERYALSAKLAGISEKEADVAIAFETVRVAVQSLLVGGCQALAEWGGEKALKAWVGRLLNEAGAELTHKTKTPTKFTIKRGAGPKRPKKRKLVT